MTKQVLFTEIREVTSGMRDGRRWVLFGYKDEDGAEYTSFKSDYQLNEPIMISYTESETKGKDDRVFINKRLVDPQDSATVETPKANQLDRIETKIDSVLRGLALLVDKKSE